jgi:hypothetical protein
MAKKEQKKVVEVPKVKKKRYFPRSKMLLGIGFVLLAVVDYLNYYSIRREFIDGAILLAGLAMINWGFQTGYYNRRKEILKRHL